MRSQWKIPFLILLSLCFSEAVRRTSQSGFDYSRLSSSRPFTATESFDCKARNLAYKYAQKLQPEGDIASIFDALELEFLCNETFTGKRKEEGVRGSITKADGLNFYVDTNKGSDSNSGTLESPFKTIQRAIFATRSQPGPASIILREGTFYLSEPLKFGPEDSNLTLTSYQGEKVYISGGIPLVTKWKPYKIDKEPQVMLYPNQNNIYDQDGPTSEGPNIRMIGSFNSTEECLSACQNYADGEIKCHSFTYFHANYTPPYNYKCYANIDFTWGPIADHNVTSGRIQQLNIYVADLSAQNIPEITGIQQVNGGKRGIRARYPNADTEIAQFPTGWILQYESYAPAQEYPTAKTILVESPARTDIDEFQQYSIGVGGPCSIFSPPESYWCSAYASGGGAGIFETPSGVQYTNTTLITDFDQAPGAVVHVWHPYHWASWMYLLDSHDPNNRTLSWSFGGFQGARGAISNSGNGGEFYLDNIFEALDNPNEWYYDGSNLYYFFNGTSAPPSDLQFVATNLDTLIYVRGTQDDPVVGFSVKNLNFVATRYTYLDPHGVPSGGDWAMQRSAALFFEGTVDLTVSNNYFTRLDGNALILSGFHRYAELSYNQFKWIGDSGMVSWGHSEGIDGTNGNQPRFTSVLYNIASEIGHFEKQSSPWFQAISCQTKLVGNIFFNGPRALINFNDGFGGANVMTQNLLFNANRETSDQGPFNSWDRLPFMTDVLDGTPSLTPQFNDIYSNFFICNYGSNMCIDNDDGSAYYNNHHNFEVYGGHKSDFGGHNKFTYSSLVAFAQDYTQGLCGDFWAAIPGYVDGYYNNTCVQGSYKGVPYITMSNCDPFNVDPNTLPVLFNNRIYNEDANVTVLCGNVTLTEKEFQKLGFDMGTKGFPMPTDDQIISWAADLLGM